MFQAESFQALRHTVRAPGHPKDRSLELSTPTINPPHLCLNPNWTCPWLNLPHSHCRPSQLYPRLNPSHLQLSPSWTYCQFNPPHSHPIGYPRLNTSCPHLSPSWTNHWLNPPHPHFSPSQTPRWPNLNPLNLSLLLWQEVQLCLVQKRPWLQNTF